MTLFFFLDNPSAKERRQAKVAELAGRFHLESILDRRAGKLSGGWQRRLSIAMALVSESEILFLDEPTLGLDVLARGELWEIIRSLKGRVTIILTTHYMGEAEALSDRVGIMGDGRLLTVGTPEELKLKAGTDSFEAAVIGLVKGAGNENPCFWNPECKGTPSGPPQRGIQSDLLSHFAFPTFSNPGQHSGESL